MGSLVSGSAQASLDHTREGSSDSGISVTTRGYALSGLVKASRFPRVRTFKWTWIDSEFQGSCVKDYIP